MRRIKTTLEFFDCEEDLEHPSPAPRAKALSYASECFGVNARGFHIWGAWESSRLASLRCQASYDARRRAAYRAMVRDNALTK